MAQSAKRPENTAYIASARDRRRSIRTNSGFMLEDVEQAIAAAEAEAEGKRVSQPDACPAQARDQSRRVAQTFASRGGRRRSRRGALPLLQQASGQARRGRLERLDMIPARFKVIAAPAQIHMPRMRREAQAPGARTSDRGRHSDRGADRGGGHRQIRGPSPPIGRLRSMAARASNSTARRWPITGTRRLRATARLRAIVRHLRRARTSSSPTRRARRCSILADGRPRPASCGPMPATTGPGAVPVAARRLRLRAPDRKHERPAASGRPLDASRSMAARYKEEGGQRGRRLSAGARAAKLLRHPGRGPRPRSPSRRWRGSAASTPSNAISGARSFGAAGRPPSPRQTDPPRR